MNHRHPIVVLSSLGLLAALVLAGCKKEEMVTSYVAPKDAPKTASTDMPGAGDAAPELTAGAPQGDEKPTWTVPDGWKPLPAGGMRYAAFAATADQPPLPVTVVQATGSVLANVNRWEGQLGLPATSDEDLGSVVKQLDINGVPALTVDLLGPPDAKGGQQRMLAAILPREGMNWFFKMVGPPEKVGSQQANFDAFVRSVHFSAAPSVAGASPTGSTPTGPTPIGPTPDGPPMADPNASQTDGGLAYAPPPGWEKDPDTNPMRMFGYRIGSGENKAEITVARLGAESFKDVEGNLSRWRGQVGLPPADETTRTDVKQSTVGGMDCVIADMTGPAADGNPAKRLRVAVVPDNQGMVWFFKILGPADVVTQQQPAYEQFLSSIKFPGGK